MISAISQVTLLYGLKTRCSYLIFQLASLLLKALAKSNCNGYMSTIIFVLILHRYLNFYLIM